MDRRGSAPPHSAIARRYVEVEGRAIHYRIAGNGPAVILLHDSPRSSRLHLATMRHLAQRFRVYALDTPGYGESAPLDMVGPGIADFAQALGRAIAALDLGDAPIYATHTSAKIALHHAATTKGPMPRRVLLDGLSLPQHPATPAFISAYMRPFRLDDSGGYLAAEWTRIRDMLRWFPWFAPAPAHRMPVATPSDAWIHDYSIDLLSAGSSYSDAYAAAMRYDAAPMLRAVRCPVLVAARADDVLYASLDAVPVVENPNLSVERLPADREAWLAWLEARLAEACAGVPPAPEPPAQPDQGRCYVDLPHGAVRLHRRQGDGAPLLILSAPTTLEALRWRDALPQRTTLVPELPGFGESDAWPAAGLGDYADMLAALLDALDIERADVLGAGFAVPLATALASRHAAKIGHVLLDGCFDLAATDRQAFADALCPAFRFDPAGGHLHAAWHMLRDMQTNWPWHARTASSIRSLPPAMDAPSLHAALVGILKQPGAYGDVARAACLELDQRESAAMTRPTFVFVREGDPAYAGAARFSGGAATLAGRPDDMAEAAARVLDFLQIHEMTR